MAVKLYIARNITTADKFTLHFDQDSELNGTQIDTSRWKLFEHTDIRRNNSLRPHATEEEVSDKKRLYVQPKVFRFLRSLAHLPTSERIKVLSSITNYNGLTKEDHLRNIRYFASHAHFENRDSLINSINVYLNEAGNRDLTDSEEIEFLLQGSFEEIVQKFRSEKYIYKRARSIIILETFRPKILFKLQFYLDLENAFNIVDNMGLKFASDGDLPNAKEKAIIKFKLLKLVDPTTLSQPLFQKHFNNFLEIKGKLEPFLLVKVNLNRFPEDLVKFID